MDLMDFMDGSGHQRVVFGFVRLIECGVWNAECGMKKRMSVSSGFVRFRSLGLLWFVG